MMGALRDGPQFHGPSWGETWINTEGVELKEKTDPILVFDAPIFNDKGESIAAIAMAVRARGEFSKIFKTARIGDSGETYAFDEKGTLLNESRFTEKLRKSGLLYEDTSILEIYLKDPGGNILKGYKPKKRLESRLPTQEFLEVMHYLQTGKKGASFNIITEAFRDYRGVKVVGAWKWLDEYGFAIGTKVDLDEAFAPLNYLRFLFFVLFLVVVAMGLIVLFSSYTVVRLQQSYDGSKKMGQYSLLEKIGEGGMGVVYFASHALLHRPTAVKLLKPEFTDDENIKRFEHEVRMASRLSHHNTIEIYDFGLSEQGVFYCAMEYLKGLNLKELVESTGRLPYERVIYILEQVSLSLREAHEEGLIHRDIKPLNIMLCYSGGACDVIKVLDFGLVKDILHASKEMTLTRQITGTPMYMSPERLKSPKDVDDRSDIYAVGAVAYYLITGRTIFQGDDDMNLLYDIINSKPRSIEVFRDDIPKELSDLVFSCLEKDPSKKTAEYA